MFSMMRACDQFDFRYDFIEISRTVSPPLKLRTCGGDIVSPSIYCYCGLTPIHSKNLPIHSAVIGTLRVFELSGKLSRCSEDSFRASKKSTPRCLMKNVNDSSLPERWQSGRMRRIANALWELLRFSISFAKLLWFQLLTTIFYLSILSMETLKLPDYPGRLREWH